MRTLKLADLGLHLDEVVQPWAAAVLADPDRIDDLKTALAEAASTPEDPQSVTLGAALTDCIAEGGQQIIDYFEAAIAADCRIVFSELALHSDGDQVDSVLASLNNIEGRQWIHNVARDAISPPMGPLPIRQCHTAFRTIHHPRALKRIVR